MTDVFTAHHVIEYPGGYTRSVGPVIGRFLTGTARRQDPRGAARRRSGARAADRVRPDHERRGRRPTAITGSKSVRAAPCSRSRGCHEPRPGQARARQAVRVRARSGPTAPTPRCCTSSTAAAPTRIRVGSRVAPRWRAERTGSITDIEAWIPLGDGEEPEPAPLHVPAEDEQPVTGINVPIKLEYELTAGVATSRYLKGLGEGKIIGGRAPSSDEVYAASRGTDPKSGEPTSVEVEVRDTGVITTFCVVNVPGLSDLAPEIPYVSAQILLDGANNCFFGLIRGIPGRRRAHGSAGQGQVGRRARSPITHRSNGSNPPANPMPTTRCTRTTSDA